MVGENKIQVGREFFGSMHLSKVLCVFLSMLLSRVTLTCRPSSSLLSNGISSYRCRSSLTSPHLQCLVRTLALPKVLSQILFLSNHSLTMAAMDTESSQARCFQLIKKFIRVAISFLLEVMSPSPSLPVTVHGAMADGDRSRRVYCTATTAPELKWIQLDSEFEDKGRGPMTELLQLLKVVLSAHIPVDALAQLEAACSPFSVEQGEPDPLFGRKKGYLMREEDFALGSKPLLNLIYMDQHLLASLLSSIALTHKSSNPKAPHRVCILLEDFVSFLRDTCRDFCCFLQPVLTVLAVAASSGQLPRSEIFLSILGGFTRKSASKGKEMECNEELLQFISLGAHSRHGFVLNLLCNNPFP